jgi:hypothetical protein
MRVVMARSIIQLEATHGHPAGRYRTPSGTNSIVALPRQPFLQTQNASLKFLCPPLRGGLGENLQSGSKNLLNQQARQGGSCSTPQSEQYYAPREINA